MFRSLINNFKPLSRNFSVINNVNRYEKLLFKHYEKVIIKKTCKKQKKCQFTDFYKFLDQKEIIITENVKITTCVK